MHSLRKRSCPSFFAINCNSLEVFPETDGDETSRERTYGGRPPHRTCRSIKMVGLRRLAYIQYIDLL